MNFEISICGDIRVFEQYQDVLDFINEKMAYWNNFESHTMFDIWVRKIPSQTETLGVSVKEDINLEDIFGRK